MMRSFSFSFSFSSILLLGLLSSVAQAGTEHYNETWIDGLGVETGLTWRQKVLYSSKFKEGKGKVIEGKYIIKMSDVADVLEKVIGDAIDDIVAATPGMSRESVENEFEKAFRGFSWEATSEEEKWEILAWMLQSPLVEMIEEDQEVKTQSDTICPASWGLDRIDQTSLPLDHIYHFDWTGESVDVYVLDTGIRTSHEQFEGRASCPITFVPGEDCEDGNGHGTHCAGIVGGKDFGVAKEANIIGVKVLGNAGSGSNSGILMGIDWVIQEAERTGRKSVISMSLGGGGSSQLMDMVVEAAFDAGVLVVVAAGNENANACLFQPASSQFALSVGSTTINDVRSSFSNYGNCVQIFAPGSDITSAWWTSDTATNTISGTSMATPHVAGIAALYWDQDPSLSIYGLLAKMLTTGKEVAVANADGPDSGMSLTTATFLTDAGTGPPGTDCGRYSAAPVGVFSSSSLLVMSVSVASCYFASMFL